MGTVLFQQKIKSKLKTALISLRFNNNFRDGSF